MVEVTYAYGLSNNRTVIYYQRSLRVVDSTEIIKRGGLLLVKQKTLDNAKIIQTF